MDKRNLRKSYKYFASLVAVLALPVLLYAAPEPFSCDKTTTPKFIDGRLNDWQEPYASLDRWNWRPTEGLSPVYGGTLDCSATLRLAWDNQFLYAGIAVVDDVYCPAPVVDNGDAVVLRILPSGQDTSVEIVVAFSSLTKTYLRDSAGKLTPAAQIRVGAGRGLLNRPKSPLPREDGKTSAPGITKLWYELAIPWSLLKQATPKPGSTLAVEMDVLDADGAGIRGQLKWNGAVELAIPLSIAPNTQCQRSEHAYRKYS